MSPDNRLREEICTLAASMFARGLTAGSSGNISARTSDGGLLVSPTGTCFGRLDPSRLAHFAPDGRLLSGDKPTKELPLHQAFYETRGKASAVVHLHACHSVALSTLAESDADSFLPPITPYAFLQLGHVKLLPYFRPGDPAIGDAVRGLAGKRTAIMLANHGPVVAGMDLEAACNAIEELEATARLAMLLRAETPCLLSPEQVAELVKLHDIAWGEQ